MKRKYFYILFLVVFVLFSCEEKSRSLKLLKVTEHSSSKIANSSLVNILHEKNNLDVQIDYTLSEDDALDQLEDKKVDLVIIPNNANSRKTDIRTLVPLLPRVLIILTSKKVDSMTVRDLFEKGNIYFEERSRLDSLVFKKLSYNFNIDEKKIHSKPFKELLNKRNSNSLDVYVGLVHLNSALVKELTSLNWHFFSLDNIDNYRKGSRVEGFTMLNTNSYPFVIPMSVYKGKPTKSVLTFAINDVLICRADMNDEIAYGITQTIIEHKGKLAEMNSVYNLLSFDYDSHVLSFPKHKGTTHFLSRNELPVWSKYVKMIWPLISISVVLFGILASLRTRFKRRKKQNIEMYYNSLLDIRSKSDTATEIDSFIEMLKELKVLRSRAMKSLADKKLDSGESFNIFLALYNDTKGELIEDIRAIRLKAENSKS